jgi:hypothetical protein
MTNDTFAVIAIIVLAILNAFQWERYLVALREIERLQSIVNVYKDKSGVVFGDQEVEP